MGGQIDIAKGSRWRHKRTGRIAAVHGNANGWVGYRYEEPAPSNNSGHMSGGLKRPFVQNVIVKRSRFLAMFVEVRP